jgi:hypothetical protein
VLAIFATLEEIKSWNRRLQGRRKEKRADKKVQ